jgi:hypothetical protein
MTMVDDQVVLSLAQVAEIQDELYSIQEAVRGNPVMSARVQRLIRTVGALPDKTAYGRSTREIEEEHAHMVGISKLMIQAQQQCQQ